MGDSDLSNRLSILETSSSINTSNIMKEITEIKNILLDFIDKAPKIYATKEELCMTNTEVNKHTTLINKIARGVVVGLISVVLGLIVFIYKSGIH